MLKYLLMILQEYQCLNLRIKLRKLKRDHGIKLAIVDYIQLMTTEC